MGNKKHKSLPPLPPYAQTRLEALAEEVRALWALMDFGNTKKAVLIGHKLLAGEKEVYETHGQKRNVWGQFRAHYFPEIESTRMAERYMFLSRRIPIDAPKILFCLSQASLADLIRLAGRRELQEFLADSKIEIDWQIDPQKKENKPEVARFKTVVLDLIASLKKADEKAQTNRDEAKKDTKPQPPKPPKNLNIKGAIENHEEKDSSLPEPAKHQNLTKLIDNIDDLFGQMDRLLTSITGRKDFKGRKRTRLRVKLIKYRRILNLFIDSTSEKHEGSVKLAPSRAGVRAGSRQS